MTLARNPVKLIVFGANRGVGRCIVEQALAAGHTVTAAVRSPASMDLAHPRLAIVQCDARDPAQVDAAIPAHDTVFVTLGEKTSGPITLYSDAAKTVTAAMARHNIKRLMFLSNFGMLDEKGRGLQQSLLLFAVKNIIRTTLDDHRRALEVLRASDLDWTAVRAMPLSDKPATGGHRTTAEGLPPGGSQITRSDLAAFMLAEATDRAFVRMTPAIAA
jgi:putative NADH-flavin reductase